jgi:hypothetical protein
MSYFIHIFLFFFVVSCTTININIVHSQGKAEDLIDSTQDASPDVKVDSQIDAKVAPL